MENLEKFFNPRSIAIVGASDEPEKVGNVIARNILELGYAGKVFLVNSKHENVLGQNCFRDISEIEEEIDLAIVAIPAEFVNSLIQKASEKVKNWVVVSAGFGEIGEDGKNREKELQEITKKNDLHILGPNCLGFIIPSLKLNASFAGGLPESGNIAFVSQSGALAVALMDLSKKESLRFSSVISIGNKMQLDEKNILEYLEKDEKTKVIGMYLEGITDGRGFLQKASKIKKPIVILKAGKTEKSQKAIASHTGALAGDDEMVDIAFFESGIVRAKNIEEFVSLLKLFSCLEPPKNQEVIVLTNAGGLGVLATDAFKNKKIKLAEISPEAKVSLREFLPKESSLSNPVDLLGDADEERYQKALAILKKEKADSILCLLTPQNQTPVEKIAEEIVKFRENSSQKVITVFMGGEKIIKGKNILQDNGIPEFLFVDESISALDKYFSWKERNCFWSEEKTVKSKVNAKLFEKVFKENKKALSYQEAQELFQKYDLLMLPVFGEISPKIEYPVAVKVDSDQVLHKTDQGGLELDIKNEEELQVVFSKMREKFLGEKIIIQPMVKKGSEIILGMKKDAIFGPIIVFGLGGIYTEVFKLVDFILPKTNQERIAMQIKESRIGFLFQEFRGQKSHDLEEFSQIIANFSRLILENEEIRGLDINPLIIYSDGEKAKLVDVKVIVWG